MAPAGSALSQRGPAASQNPLTMLGIRDRGTLEVGQRADLVELDDDLQVRRVMRGGRWVANGG